MTSNDQKALTFFGEAGFEFWETGGGCTAFGRNLDGGNDAYILITAEGGGYHPDDNDRTLWVGYHDADTIDGELEVVEGWTEAVEAANRLVEKHLGPVGIAP